MAKAAALIKTKIVATVGPASRDRRMLERLMAAGVDVFRLNFSHGARAEHEQALRTIRALTRRRGDGPAVMADLCGPKIRVGQIAGGGVLLVEGAEVTIQRRTMVGTVKRFSTTLAELIDDVRKGQRIRLDDGKIELEVIGRRPPQAIVCRVLTGGMLTSSKGVNLPQTALKLSAVTEKDRADARWLAKQDIDYVALSFVQRAADVKALRKILRAGGSDAHIIAKIEKPQALRNIDGILAASDGIMVARGDLGVEMELPEVPLAQKRLVRLAAGAGKVCIVATQMLETMTDSASPTRAEVSDVANAVLDGADAVMLSGETAVGKYPEKTARMMNSILKETGRYHDELRREGAVRVVLPKASAVGEDLLAVARAVAALVDDDRVKAVAAFTISGETARVLSRMRLPVPILALTPSRTVAQQMSLLYGTAGREAPICKHTRDILAVAADQARRLRWASKGEKIVVASGRPLGVSGTINTLVVHSV